MTTSERRPRVREAALQSTARTTDYTLADSSSVPVDLIALTPSEFDLFLAGYRSGYRRGVDAGRDQADAEAAALHRTAYRIVQSAAKLDPWPVAQVARRSREEAAGRASRATAALWAREGVVSRHMHVYAPPGEAHALVRASAREWFKGAGIPALRSNTHRGYHIRAERLGDLVARAELDGWTVHVHDARPRS